MVCLQSLHSVGVVTISFHIFLICPFRFVFFALIFSAVGLHPVFCMYPSFLTSILHMILHGLLFVFCVLFLLIFHGVYIIRIMGFIFVGGLILLFMYHHLFVYSLWSL